MKRKRQNPNGYFFPIKCTTSPAPEMNFLITSSEDYQDERRTAFEFALRVFIYTSVLAVFLMVIALTLKLLEFCDGAAVANGEIRTETSGLLSKEAAPIIYGVFEEDEESGTCSRSSSSEDLFEGKVCVICYDKRRSWFFSPCGHCATCSSCTRRILEGEAKTCPFCRGFIHKVSRLLNHP